MDARNISKSGSAKGRAFAGPVCEPGFAGAAHASVAGRRTLAENGTHHRLHSFDTDGGPGKATGCGPFGRRRGRLEKALSPLWAGRKKHTAMRLGELMRSGLICGVAATMLAAAPAYAFDDKIFDDKGGLKPQSSPWAVFQFGFSAYKSGHKTQAAEAYRYAAENGQIGATWKLARMYATGDGVDRNDYEAFKFFSEIADQDVEPGSPEESYVSDALVALGNYLKAGIPGSPVRANSTAAQEYYMRAAANYRNPTAQFEMGKMFLKGDGGVKSNMRQAGRWLQLAAEKGHAGAQATLGNLLFQSGKVVRGLAMMTAALERAAPTDQPWIRGMQEEAFSLAGEADRRTAIALAQDMLGKGTVQNR